MKQNYPTTLILFFIILFSGINLYSQRHYPVKVDVRIMNNSVFLSDYRNPENFQVRVGLKDLYRDNYKIKLKLEISGENQVYTSELIHLTLNKNEIRYLNYWELDSLFRPFADAVLSEGMWTFRFTCYDARVQNLVVSNSLTDAGRTMVLLKQPPILQQPANNSTINLAGVNTPVMFSWIPRAIIASPNTRIKYRLRIVKLTSPDQNPYNAISGNTVDNFNSFEINDIDYSNYIFNPGFFSDTLFSPGTVIAWQVVAYESANNNDDRSGSFANQGKSDVFTFSIREDCISLSPISATVVNDVVRLEWSYGGTHQEYEIKYRRYGTSDSWTIVRKDAWYGNNFLELGRDQLLANTNYEFSVRGRCTNWMSPIYGGTFRLNADVNACVAPFPINIVSNNAYGVELEWANIDNIESYEIRYKHSSNQEFTTEITNNNNFSLPALAEGQYYDIRVNAICSDNATAMGDEYRITGNSFGFAGDCPLPSPLIVNTWRSPDDINKANVRWSDGDIYSNYKFIYWSDVAENGYLETSDPHSELDSIESDVIYGYKIEFYCTNGTNVTSPDAIFRIDASPNDRLELIPNTADCFPPSEISAEARSTTRARFEWSRVQDADEYQLFYALENSDEYQPYNTTARRANIRDLQDSQKYNYKVRCRCGADYSIFSNVGLVDLSATPQTGSCDTIPFVMVLNTTKNQVQLAWKYETKEDGTAARSGYTINYIDAAQSWSQQYTESLQNTDTLFTSNISGDTVKYTFLNFREDTEYLFKISAWCGTDKAQSNEIISGRTKSDAQQGDCQSGAMCDRSSTEPMSPIAVGDTIYMADQMLTIDSISPQRENIWSGVATLHGYSIPGLEENVQMRMSFDNIFVNDNACVVSGSATMDSVVMYLLDENTRNLITENMANIDSAISQINNYLNIADSALGIANEWTATQLDNFQGGGGIGMPITGSLGEQHTTTSNLAGRTGQQILQEIGASQSDCPLLVRDSQGNVYQVDAEGSSTLVGQYQPDIMAGVNRDTIYSDHAVQFAPAEGMKYGYDAFVPRYAEKPTMRPHYLNIADKYFDAKAITPSDVDYVLFSTSSGLDISKLTFTNREGFVFNTDFINSKITLAGGPAGDAQEVFAVYEDGGEKKIIGALLLASYPIEQKEVKIILTQPGQTITDDQLQTLTEKVNSTYSQAGIRYNLSIDATFNDGHWCGRQTCNTFTPTGSGLLSNNYTGDEHTIIETYMNRPSFVNNITNDTAYIFAIGAPIDNTGGDEGDLQGKMNFSKQFGFLYNVNPTTNYDILGRTLAHELGHGNYKLYHIFDEIYLGEHAKLSTNVMSYSTSPNALQLNKLQWDIMHKPGVTWGVFERDGDQEARLRSADGYFLITQNLTDTIGQRIDINSDYNIIVSNKDIFVRFFKKDSVDAYSIQNCNWKYRDNSENDTTIFKISLSDVKNRMLLLT
jgi:hypothetical protein